MGRKTRALNEKAEAIELGWQLAIKTYTEKIIAKQVPIEAIDEQHLNDLVEFNEFFVRDPKKSPVLKSKNANKRMISLVRHLFNVYPVPSHLNDVWVTKQKLPMIEGTNTILYGNTFKNWYICVAQGGSFYKEHAKSFMTKAEVHHFLACSFHVSLVEAIWFAVAKAAGANDGFARSLAKTKLNEQVFGEFWKRVTRWFVLHRETKLNVATMNDVLDYVIHRHRESPETFTLSGHSIEAIKKRTEDWHRDLMRMKNIGGGTWEGQALSDVAYTTGKAPDKTTWTLTQIKTGNDLAAEGNAMRHCVAAYKSSCISGHTSIWSLRKDQVRALTIEVRDDGNIAQVRGHANRQARPDEANIVKTWARDAGLSVSSYL